MTPYFPVPAVKGGAVETMVENLLQANENDESIHFTVVSCYDSDAKEKSSHFLNARFIYIDCNHFWCRLSLFAYKAINRVFHLRLPFLDFYHSIGTRKILSLDPDLVIVEGGCLTHEFAALSRKLGKDRMAIHLHAKFESSAVADNIFGHVLAISRFVADAWIKTSSLSSENVYVLKNCIDTSRFDKKLTQVEQNALRNRLGIESDDIILIFCGRIVPEKGIRELINAIELCENPKIKLLIVGDTNFGLSKRTTYLEQIRQLVAKNKDRIRMTGYIENSLLYQYYSIADIAVVPSIWDEPAGLVAIEAMVTGTPLVATKAGGLPEYVNDECAVIVLRDGLIQNLSKAFKLIMETPNLLDKMAQQCLAEATRYSLEAYHHDFSEVLEKIFASSSSGR